MKMMDSRRFKKMVCCATEISRKPDKHHKAIEKHSFITADQLISDDSGHKKKKRHVIAHVPRGFMAVYVEPGHCRFIIPTKILLVPEFKELMDKVAEEYGYEQQGGLSIPCNEDDFKELLMTCKLYSKTNKCMPYNVHTHHHHSCITPAIHV